jgi:hypothetical protein
MSETFGEADSPNEQNEYKEESKHTEPDWHSESIEDGFGGFDEPDETPI